MAQTVCVVLNAADRSRLEAIASDRNRPRKYVDRARVVLASVGGQPAQQVAREDLIDGDLRFADGRSVDLPEPAPLPSEQNHSPNSPVETDAYRPSPALRPLANVADTSVWQLAVLPRAEAYCAATPTEWLPFFGSAVSSITKTALSPPTSRSA